MKRIVIILFAFAMFGCARPTAIPVDGSLSHEEVITRLKKSIHAQFLAEPRMWGFLFSLSEERISPPLTRLVYIGALHPPTGLATVASAEVTTLSIDTSTKREARVSVKTELRGDRQLETESMIIRELSIIKERADKSINTKEP